MRRNIRFILAAALAPCLTATPTPAHAGQPRWELGLGVGSLYYPDYRGSDESRFIAVPLPYVIYRGKRFRINRKGAMARLFNTRRLSLRLSGSGALPVNSSHNDARSGMPNLDPTVGAGPELRVLLSNPAHRNRQFYLEFPAQAIFAVNFFHIHYEGFVFHPQLGYHQVLHNGRNRWDFGATLGPLFATNRYHRYYYSVAPRYARPGRPAYEASGGYSGTRATGGVFFKRGRLGLGLYARYDWLGGAAFEQSPLVKRDYSLIVGTAVVWRLWEGG